MAVYYKNRAACYLKIEKYNEAIVDCTRAVEIAPNDPKALFRRCQAYEALERHQDAYKDAVRVMTIDPKNKAVQQVLTRLNPIIQEKVLAVSCASKMLCADSAISVPCCAYNDGWFF